MKISEKTYSRLLEILLLVIAATLIFKKLCTFSIILFAVFGLIFLKKLDFSKEKIKLSLLIALPLLVEILFFWNNDSSLLGLKYLEKSTSLLIFPLFIVGNWKYINFKKIARYYSIITTCVVFCFFVFYINFNKEYVTLYSQDPQYFWSIGYDFARNIGMHGPALNMHLAFVSICNFYFIFKSNTKHNILLVISNVLFFCSSLYFVIFINSKLALLNVLFGMLIIFIVELRKIYSIKKISILFITFFSIVTMLTYHYVKQNPYMIVKYKEVTFAHIDKIGKLDEVENPTATIYNSLVTRLSIWKSTIELISKNYLIGVGSSDGKPVLFKYYEQTHQRFLAVNLFPVHNQYLDSMLRFGIIGLLSTLIYVLNIFYLWVKSKNTLILFFFLLFFTSNLTDDFLIRFDGIVFSGFWISVFSAYCIKKEDVEIIL